ncbi:hypothetical protein SDC9_189460 [bioreactor metagenome]|uniref:Uncharacterized protein n=1 Tax=bioreactor metagenome TaxID=1076179 RepID=A0A645HS80_9ZZZZ
MAPDFQRFVNPHGNIGRLLVNRRKYGAGIAVKPLRGIVISDFPNYLSGDFWNIYIAACRYFPHNQYEASRRNGLAGDMRHRVLLQDRVQNRVGNLIAYFIGMAFRHRFRCEKMFSHCFISFYFSIVNSDSRILRRFI